MLACAAAIGSLFLVLWLLSLLVRDVSIVDIAWGPGFALAAWVAYATGDGCHGRRILLAILVTIWGGRLGAYLARRNIGHGEDPRYVAMRRHHGARFWLVSLGTVFVLQAVLMWVVSLPLQGAASLGSRDSLGVLDWLGVALWAVGLGFESIGDAQLARFRADPASKGQVMDKGLWRYTRHPNYFGDFCIWWGFGLIALSAGAWWSLVGPLIMTVLLTRVSGKDLLEKSIGKRRPGYAEYVKRTSGFFPRPPQ